MASSRRPNGVITPFSFSAITLPPGGSDTVVLPATWGEPGLRDIRVTVWEEASKPTLTRLADTGWLTEYTRVLPATSLTNTEAESMLQVHVMAAKADLAARPGVSESSILLESSFAVNWPNSGIGCTKKADTLVLTIITPGSLIVLKHAGQTYEYHSDVNGPPTLCQPAAQLTVNLNDSGGKGPFAFAPADLTFEVGETVEFTLVGDSVFHTFTVDDLGIDVDVDGGATVNFGFTFDEPGEYTLICIPHQALGMIGTIVVK